MIVQLKQDGQGDGAVDGAQHVIDQGFGFQGEVEDFDFRHPGPRRQVDGLRGEFVLPGDLLDLFSLNSIG